MLPRPNRLLKRRDFLRVRGGARWTTQSHVLEAKERAGDKGAAASVARFGFTVTKRVGAATVRNRIKRRLREAVRQAGLPRAKPSHDYVLIARPGALERSFEELVADIGLALERVHRDRPRRSGGGRKRRGGPG